MQGDPAIRQALNQALRNQLTAINQYFLHARICGNWGLGKLNHSEYKRSIKAMKQADKLIERILFLEGLPNLQHLGKLYIGQHTLEVLNCDVRKVKENIDAIQKAVALTEQTLDYVTRDLVQEILEKEEEYLDWTTTQLDLAETVGIENYIQSRI